MKMNNQAQASGDQKHWKLISKENPRIYILLGKKKKTLFHNMDSVICSTTTTRANLKQMKIQLF